MKPIDPAQKNDFREIILAIRKNGICADQAKQLCKKLHEICQTAGIKKWRIRFACHNL
jgi:hypothetical protein